MMLWWGPDLVQIYNDAFRVLLADKHPAAAGQGAAGCWTETWDQLAPVAAGVLAGSDATYFQDQLVLISRSGFVEETYWTFSHSGITNQAGDVGGLLIAASEVTAQVISARRLATVRGLSDVSVSGAGTVAEVCAAAIGVLSRDCASVPFAAAFLTDDDGANLRLAGSYALASDTTLKLVRIQETTGLGRVAATGVSEVLSGLAGRVAPGTITPGPLGPAIPDQAMLLPLWAAGRDRPAGVLALGVSPYRTLDTSYRTLLELIAREVSVLMTDALAYESQRARAAELTELERRQTEFYQNVSHELRTPLTLIQGPVHDLLADSTVDLAARHRAGLRVVERAAAQLRRLVDTLLVFSRVEGGVLHPDTEPTDLPVLTAGLVSMFRSGAESAGLHLDLDVSGMDGPVDVDRGMWSTIVVNLLSNAVKFTAKGAISVGLATSERRVELTVTDTGPGIPKAQLPLLFDRFHLVPTLSRRRSQGAGIGLALVADLVHANGGDITAHSTLGRGSTFTVTVPIGVRPAASSPPRPLDAPGHDVTALADETAPAAEPIGVPAQSVEPTAGIARRGTVLLVEDNDDMRAYLARLLAQDGWQVHDVADVDQALAVTFVPDIVLCDVMLPGRDGLDFVRLLRATATLSDVPVLLLTARAGPDAAAEGLAAGADDYVTKPFHAQELLARIGVHYELSKLRRYALHQAQSQVADLRAALASNRQIGAAIGVLMNSGRLTEEQAFTQLREASQHSNRKLRDVADDVIHTGALP